MDTPAPLREAPAQAQGERLTLKYVELGTVLRWIQNPKLHDLGGIIESIHQHGFKKPIKYEPRLNGGLGGIVAGNGREEALQAMQDAGEEAPRGILALDGKWYLPVVFGVDSPSQEAAQAYGLDDNNLTLMGGDFGISDLMRMYGPQATGLIRSLAEASSLPVSIDGDTVDALLHVIQPEPYTDLEEQSEALAPIEDSPITIIVPAKHKEAVMDWLANGEAQRTGPALGKGVLKRCGLL